jgi:oxalate decarboxylase/phosphoglucose isomerase-like protein (cupin superfamily)
MPSQNQRTARRRSKSPQTPEFQRNKHCGRGQLQGAIEVNSFNSNRGDAVQIPKGALHNVENASVEEPVTFISIYSPAGMDQYFQKLAHGLKSGQLAHGGREALQKEYDVVFEGPFFTQRKRSQ